MRRMAGVFDIELHDGDSISQDESDDDIVENREVRFLSNFIDFRSLINLIYRIKSDMSFFF